MQKQPKVTIATNVNELITTYPDSVEILIEYGIPCASCHFSSYDTIQDSVVEFGLEEDDVKELLEQLNEVVKRKTQPQKENSDIVQSEVVL